MVDRAAELARLIEVVRFQAESCRTSGSPLYGRILDGVAVDMEAEGVTADLLLGVSDEPLAAALALRLLGAVHRIVLDGRAPELAVHYPSVGGGLDDDPVPPFLAAVRRHRDEIRRRIGEGVQTNEVGRAAVLVGGYAVVASRTNLPLRVREVGASAGLNLRWDHFRYDTGEVVAGDADSAVRFSGVWIGRPPDLPAAFDVADRLGCDRNPLDATSEEGRLTLMSYVWPDQLERLHRLQAAIDVARSVPAAVERADAPEWVAAQLAAPTPGLATVVTHSIVLQYLPTESRSQLRRVIAHAGAQATGAAPLAWLRMEPAGERAELRLTTWPRGTEQVLATAGYHGSPIWWSDGPSLPGGPRGTEG